MKHVSIEEDPFYLQVHGCTMWPLSTAVSIHGTKGKDPTWLKSWPDWLLQLHLVTYQTVEKLGPKQVIIQNQAKRPLSRPFGSHRLGIADRTRCKLHLMKLRWCCDELPQVHYAGDVVQALHFKKILLWDLVKETWIHLRSLTGSTWGPCKKECGHCSRLVAY